jgi:hypothetical protein
MMIMKTIIMINNDYDNHYYDDYDTVTIIMMIISLNMLNHNSDISEADHLIQWWYTEYNNQCWWFWIMGITLWIMGWYLVTTHQYIPRVMSINYESQLWYFSWSMICFINELMILINDDNWWMYTRMILQAPGDIWKGDFHRRRRG